MVKSEIVLSSEFESAILKSFRKLQDVRVTDIHAVQNYIEYYEGCYDSVHQRGLNAASDYLC